MCQRLVNLLSTILCFEEFILFKILSHHDIFLKAFWEDIIVLSFLCFGIEGSLLPMSLDKIRNDLFKLQEK